MHACTRFGLFACFAALTACGARSPLQPGGEGAADADGGASGGESHTAGGTDAGGTDAGGSGAGGGTVALPQCLCPNLPGYSACVLPLMCCPVVATCEDPASFNCTGSEAFFCDE